MKILPDWVLGRRANVVLGAILLGVIALCGCSSTSTPTDASETTPDGLSIHVTADPAVPHSGDNNLEVTLKDAKTGLPVVDANVAGTVTMTSPQLPGNTQTGRSRGNGLYEIPVQYPTATSYDISVDVERPGHKAADLNFSIETDH